MIRGFCVILAQCCAIARVLKGFQHVAMQLLLLFCLLLCRYYGVLSVLLYGYSVAFVL